VDARVVAATNRDLEQEVAAGSFRRDLYFRLVGVRITIPPLRDRMEDLPPLAQSALERIAREPGMRRARLTRDALALLMNHRWPGNVRELEQALRRAVLVAEGEEIHPEDLALELAPVTRQVALRGFDRSLVEQALRASNGNRSAAARALGISRVTLHRWIKRYELA
jgi:DNA-binding NtrC family response regulator